MGGGSWPLPRQQVDGGVMAVALVAGGQRGHGLWLQVGGGIMAIAKVACG